MKILPILLVLFLFVPGDETLLSCAIGIGVGFATFENCCYLLSFGTGSLAFILVRGLAVGVMHIISIIAEAVGLIIVRRFNAISLPGITGALAIALMISIARFTGGSRMQGTYNYGSFLIGEEAGGYVLVGLIAFLLGVVLTAIIYKRRCERQ